MGRDEESADPDPSRSTDRSARNAASGVTGRRAFLGSLLAAGGVGAALAFGRRAGDAGSPDGYPSAGREEVSIVYAFARPGGTDSTDGGTPRAVEPREKTVPADWYGELSTALSVHGELPAAELTGFLGSFVVPGTYDEPSASIAIQATAEALREEVAALSLDVDVSVDVLGELPDPTGETGPIRPEVTADLGDRSVPGGVFCGNDERRGSLTPALRDPEADRRYFATANHLYGGSGTDHRGDPLYVFDGDESETVGRIRRGFVDDDLVLADPVDEHVPAGEVSAASPGAVGGQLTKLGLADLKARGEPLEMTGAVSGRTSGEIEGIDGVTFYTGEGVRTGQLLWGDEETFTDGDSGSVNYHVDPEDDDRVLVGGLNSARTWWPGADFTWGTAAYVIRERHGLVF